MAESGTAVTALRASDYARILAARDARFDGLFFVGVTTTRVYCRPVCPARVTHQDRRRFFESAAAAERAGFRPCMRCRPELAPGRSLVDAVSRLASDAAGRIAAGALNGRCVATLAEELGVSERHLRRALEREIGVSPVELAQTHRLLLAKRLLTDTSLSVTRVAYASGFQSLRRFNATFRERYRLTPSALRRGWHRADVRGSDSDPGPHDAIKLTLAYRTPFAWQVLLDSLRREALPGVEIVEGARYRRLIRIEGQVGLLAVQNASDLRRAHLEVWLCQALVPVVMPLLARVRQLFDLDAEPAVIEAHLAESGLADAVRGHPGLRVPGAPDGFEAAFRALLRGGRESRSAPRYAGRVVAELGEPFESGDARLRRCVPTAERVAEAGAARLVRLGVPGGRAQALVAVANGICAGSLCLERGGDPAEARRALTIAGVNEAVAEDIVLRALGWPDAFPLSDRALQRAVGASSAAALRARAEPWRPWRAYAAQHYRVGARALPDG